MFGQAVLISPGGEAHYRDIT